MYAIICIFTVINYSGRASELGGIVNLVDRRRSSLSGSERPLSQAKSITRSTIDLSWRKYRVWDKVLEESTLFGDT